ncbi:MAG: hypothetical protein J7K39_06455 [Bacteroidales bacterium]|nr:hypothetical protein [Bacteroidales bacterium]
MKTRILFMLFYLLAGNFVYSQTLCGTDSNLNPTFKSDAPTNSLLNNSYDGVNFCVNVYFHIVRNDLGQTNIPTYIPGAINGNLNGKYSPYNIQFVSLGTDFIDNSDFVTNGIHRSNAEELFSTNNHYNAIDIYIVENADWPGLAHGVHSKELMIRLDYAETNVFTHEMGHCLSLYHTHETEKNGVELVDGSNCEAAGDLVCDTPADPDLSNWWNSLVSCVFPTGSITFNNITYYPDTKNIMSYTTPDCMEHFTEGQVARLKDALIYSDILKDAINCCNSETITLTQTSEVCYSDTLILYLDNICSNTHTTWECSENIEVIEQNNFGIAIKAINPDISGLGWIRATFDNSSQIIYEELHVGVPDYYIYTGEIESQDIDIYYEMWTMLFLNNVIEESGWEWEVDYSNIRPSDAPMILIYPLVTGPISAKVRLNNRCGCGPWLTEYFEVIQDGPHKVLIK